MHHKNLNDSIIQNLSNRDNERIISRFASNNNYAINFIKNSSEAGVIRNGGRRGTCYAPAAILSVFKKLASHTEQYFNETETSEAETELTNFDTAQINETKNIIKAIKENKANTHFFIGGGHDHIYPALKAIEAIHPNKSIIIINIDPHQDMRVDKFSSSGTPFRQFDESAQSRAELFQIGSHQFANVHSSLAPTKKIEQKVLDFDLVKAETQNFTNNKQFMKLHFPNNKDVIYFFSLDVDAICSSAMEAVSAVNHRGLPLNFIEDSLVYFKRDLNCRYFGFYEYNPVFDNLSQKGARLLAALIYKTI